MHVHGFLAVFSLVVPNVLALQPQLQVKKTANTIIRKWDSFSELSGHSLALRQESGCGVAEKVCGSGCVPTTAVCCNGINPGYCDAGEYCLSDGCCPIGKTCTGTPTCDAGEVLCGKGCMPINGVCCSGEGYCDAGEVCTSNGRCSVGGDAGSSSTIIYTTHSTSTSSVQGVSTSFLTSSAEIAQTSTASKTHGTTTSTSGPGQTASSGGSTASSLANGPGSSATTTSSSKSNSASGASSSSSAGVATVSSGSRLLRMTLGSLVTWAGLVLLTSILAT